MTSGLVRSAWGLALVLACGEKGAVAPEPTLENVKMVTVETPPAPVVMPTRQEAADSLRGFTERLLAEPPGDLTTILRIPNGIRPQQLEFYYDELRATHINRAGVEAVLEKDFGGVADRLGAKAQSLADQLELPASELWVFGDLESAAILHWDGERFWVASVHQLLVPGTPL